MTWRFIRRKPYETTQIEDNVKRRIEQNLRNKNFEARNGNYETSAVVKNQGTKQREQRSLGDCWQWKANGQCSKGDSCSFRHDTKNRAKSTELNSSPRSSTLQSVRNASRTRSPRGRSPSGRMSRLPCKNYLKELAPIHSVKNGISQNACFTSPRMDADLEKKCSFAHRQVDEQPSKRSKNNGDKRAVAMLQLGCVFQDMEPPKSSSILRKSLNILKPIRCVQFTEAVVRHANIRDQNPSLGLICPGDPHQLNPNAPKFEDRSQEETECKSDAPVKQRGGWPKIVKLKEKDKTAFFSPSENGCLPAPSTLKLEERKIVVDSGASMHMISRKDLNAAELDTLTKSCSPNDSHNRQWRSADA